MGQIYRKTHPFSVRRTNSIGIRNASRQRTYGVLVRISVVFFVLSIVFENTSSRFIKLPVNIPTIAGILLVIIYLVRFPLKPKLLPMNVVLFGIYFLVMAGSELIRYFVLGYGLGGTYLVTCEMYVKLAAVIFVLYSMMHQDERIIKLVALSWAMPLIILAILVVFRIDFISYEYYGRVGVAVENLNISGHRWAGLAVCLGVYLLQRKPKSVTGLGIGIILFAFLCIAVFNSGSRGATACLVFGLAISYIFIMKSGSIAKYGLLSVILLGFIFQSLMSTDLLTKRWMTVIEDPYANPRYHYLVESIEMIAEDPIVGYGSDYVWNLADRMGKWSATESHNTPTQVFLTGGILAGVPFLIGLMLTIKQSLRNLQNEYGDVMFAALISCLLSSIFANMAHVKFFWLIVIVVTSFCAISNHNRGGASLRNKRNLRRYRPKV